MNGPEAAVESAPACMRVGTQAAVVSTASRTTLDTLVERFVAAIESGFPQRLKRRPKALERRVQYLIRVKLPPRPRPAGRPARLHITGALEMYRQQKREVEQGKRTEINWAPIGKACPAASRRSDPTTSGGSS